MLRAFLYYILAAKSKNGIRATDFKGKKILVKISKLS